MFQAEGRSGMQTPNYTAETRSQFDERRYTPRYKRQIPVTYQLDGGVERAGFTDNASAEGMFIYALQPAPSGTILRLYLYLPEIGPVTLMGEVAYLEGEDGRCGFGIRIIDGPEEWSRYWGL